MTKTETERRAGVELLAPAGDPDAAFAALRYGADAIYCGLPRFSARADAANFSLDMLNEVVGYAHSLSPRRRVYVTVNTLIQDAERRELIRALLALCDCHADGIIVQDAGVAALARRYAPALRLHASTQLAVHSIEGARTLREMGFARVVLARELSLDEIRAIATGAGIEVEVFIHGALCYAYSGLCLFSSHAVGRSGNRGRCAYCCREGFEIDAGQAADKRGSGRGFPFSMKDLAMGPHLETLRQAGVASLKIEGRMKNALYVAAVTDYYRRRLDGRMPERDRRRIEDDLRTIFSRPWTDLYALGKPGGAVIDPVNVGHRGVPIGRVEAVNGDRAGRWLCFRTSRAIEKHDGIQVDLPGEGRPFGFAVEYLRPAVPRGARGIPDSLIVAEAGSRIEVMLPPDAPELPQGAPVYCASSQAVKRSYPFERPRPGVFRQRHAMDVSATLSAERLRLEALAAGAPDVRAEVVLDGPFDPAREPSKTEAAFRRAFERTGDTPWVLSALTVADPAGRFVPVSRIQAARRQLCDALTDALAARQVQIEQAIVGQLDSDGVAVDDDTQRAGTEWSIRFRSPVLLSDLGPDDRAGIAEAVWRVGADTSEAGFASAMETLGAFGGRGCLRVALPAIVRERDAEPVRRLLARAQKAGVTKFEIANVNGFGLLEETFGAGWQTWLDVTADWSLYATNRQAVQAWLSVGVRRVTLSPEDDAANMAGLVRALDGRVVVVVFQYTPLFLSETAPEIAGGLSDGLRLKARAGRAYRTWRDGRLFVTTDERPFCLSGGLTALREAGARQFRVDLTYAPPDPAAAAEVWRAVRAGRCPPHSHDGNYQRGLQ